MDNNSKEKDNLIGNYSYAMDCVDRALAAKGLSDKDKLVLVALAANSLYKEHFVFPSFAERIRKQLRMKNKEFSASLLKLDEAKLIYPSYEGEEIIGFTIDV